MREIDAVSIGRASVDDGFEELPEQIRASILGEIFRVVFGDRTEPGISAQLKSLKVWGGAFGAVGLTLQFIQTLQLQDAIKHAIVALFGGH